MLSAVGMGKKPEYVAFSMSSSFLNHQVFYPLLAAPSKILHTILHFVSRLSIGFVLSFQFTV